MHYAASKAAVETVTVGLAQEVAEAVMWLLVPRSSYATGTVLTVGGGR